MHLTSLTENLMEFLMLCFCRWGCKLFLCQFSGTVLQLEHWEEEGSWGNSLLQCLICSYRNTVISELWSFPCCFLICFLNKSVILNGSIPYCRVHWLVFRQWSTLLFTGFLKQKGCWRSFFSLFVVRWFLKHFKAINFVRLVLYPHLSSVACYNQGNFPQHTLWNSYGIVFAFCRMSIEGSDISSNSAEIDCQFTKEKYFS